MSASAFVKRLKKIINKRHRVAPSYPLLPQIIVGFGTNLKTGLWNKWGTRSAVISVATPLLPTKT